MGYELDAWIENRPANVRRCAEGPLAAFWADFWEMTTQNPLSSFERIPVKPAPIRVCFDVRVFDGRVRLSLIRSFDRGAGWGSKGLEWLKDLARKHDVVVEGNISPTGSKPRLAYGELGAWYRRHGFRVTNKGFIVFDPQTERKEPNASK